MFKNKPWDTWLLSVLVFTIGVINLVSAISPALPERISILREVLPLLLIHGSRHIVVLVGFLLILLARGILRRKKMAWNLAFILVLLSIVLHVMKGLDMEEATLAFLVIYVMILLRPRFKAGSDIPTIKNAFILLGIVVLANLLYGMGGFLYLGIREGIHLSLAAAFRETWQVMFSITSADSPFVHHMRFFQTSLWFTWEAGLIIFIIMLFQPVVYRHTGWLHGYLRARDLAEAYGRSSLVYFTLWQDKSYFFNESQTVYIAYAQISDVAVALGDPVGPDALIESTIKEFLNFCYINSWYPAFYQVLPDHLSIYRKLGLHTLHIGDEAIVDLQSFTMDGKKFKHLRNNSHRFAREGYCTVWYAPPLSDNLLISLQKVSDNWLVHQGGDEKAFSLGWFDANMIMQTSVLTVEDESGQVLAFANFVPMYQLDQASPDLMRYTQEAPAGIMDYLFVESMLHFKNQGLGGYNLGLAPLAHVGEEENSSVTEKAINLFYNNFYNFKGLHNFKLKFNPRWEPRFLIYPNLAALPKINLAIVKADNPGGLAKFWRWALIRFRIKIARRSASP